MKFKKFKARKSNKRNGLKKAVNVALIIKIAVSAIALLTVLGVVGSMFSGSSSGSSSGGSTVRPSRPGTSAPDNEQTEETTPNVPDVDDPALLSTKSPVSDDFFNVYVGADDLKAILDYNVLGQKLSNGVGASEVMTEPNGVKYVRIYGDGVSDEAFAITKNLENKVTGKYLVFAYRLPTTNTVHTDIQIYANTIDETVTGSGDMFWVNSENDGEWHVVVIDIEQAIASSPGVVAGTSTSKFVANSDGKYCINRLRLDWFNAVASTTDYIDVAYIGLTDSISEARGADPDYTAAEFTASDIVNLKNFSNTVYYVNGMPYAQLEAITSSGGEVSTYLYESDVILNGTSRYIAVMYRNAPGQYIEVHMNSTTKLTASGFYSKGVVYYTLDDKWNLAIIELPNHSDTVCRSLRIDFVNQNSANTSITMDIAFVKFFDSQGEAQTYYENYINTYNLNAE